MGRGDKSDFPAEGTTRSSDGQVRKSMVCSKAGGRAALTDGCVECYRFSSQRGACLGP